MSDRIVERVDPHWIDDVARLPEGQLDRIAARWIDLIDFEECEVDPHEKPMLRELAGDLLTFCRRARDAEDVLLAWTIWAERTGHSGQIKIKTSPTIPNASSTIADWIAVGASAPGAFCRGIAALPCKYLASIPQLGPCRAPGRLDKLD